MEYLDINEYLKLIIEIPEFLKKYLNLTILTRLKHITYFCGMDYASKSIYNFKYYITRYDHSISTALITWRYTKDKKMTLAALFHDIATPVFSHTIDFMHEDYVTQETTEEKTETILENSKELLNLLKEDNLIINEIKDIKKYSIVDNKRPKMCADRLDGIILMGLAWSKTLDIKEVPAILNNIKIFTNLDNELELGFISEDIVKKIININNKIDELATTKEDKFEMNLLANITKYLINKNLIIEDDLYILKESEVLNIAANLAKKDQEFNKMWQSFRTIKPEEISNFDLPNIKRWKINPLLNGERYLK